MAAEWGCRASTHITVSVDSVPSDEGCHAPLSENKSATIGERSDRKMMMITIYLHVSAFSWIISYNTVWFTVMQMTVLSYLQTQCPHYTQTPLKKMHSLWNSRSKCSIKDSINTQMQEKKFCLWHRVGYHSMAAGSSSIWSLQTVMMCMFSFENPNKDDIFKILFTLLILCCWCV